MNNTLRITVTLLSLVLSSVQVFAGAGTIAILDGGGVSRTYDVITDGSGNYVSKMGICDQSAAANCVAVNGSNQLSVTGPVTNAGTFATQSAITAASGSVASGAVASGALAVGSGTDGWNVTEGAKADSVCGTATGTCSLVALTKYIANAVNSPIPAGTNVIGGITIASGGIASGAISSGAFASGALASGSVASGAFASGAFAAGSFINATAGDPCMFQAKTNLAISQNGTSSVQLIALSGSTSIYVCSLSLIAAGATTVALTTGTGTACVTGNAAVVGSTTANIANSMSLSANGGIAFGNGGGTIAKGASSSELCMILGSNVFVSGNLTYVQQ